MDVRLPLVRKIQFGFSAVLAVLLEITLNFWRSSGKPWENPHTPRMPR